MDVNRPVQVFTDIKKVQKPVKNFIVTPSDNMNVAKDSMNVSALDRQINVTGVGEMTLPPDRFSVTIKCKAVKETVQDAKLSVTRRLDYIIQSLKNVNLKVHKCFFSFLIAFHENIKMWDTCSVFETLLCPVNDLFLSS